MIKHINEETLKKEINKNSGVCLVDFYATWCGPCMMLAPILEEISNEYDVYKIDVDENPNISNELKIDTIPTLCVYKNGDLMEKQIGFKSKEELIRLIKKYM